MAEPITTCERGEADRFVSASAPAIKARTATLVEVLVRLSETEKL
jgi:hypothetical protein